MAPSSKNQQPIIVKKIKKGDHDAHSTAWKIALADFMTALMCFFLVMWLTTILKTDTKPDVSRFFNASGVDESDVGIGGILGGSTITVDGPLSEMAAEFTVVPPMGAVEKNESEVLGRYVPEDDVSSDKAGGLPLVLQKEQEKAMQHMAHAISEGLSKEGELGKQVRITREKKYIRIDFLDTHPDSMFAIGSQHLLPRARRVVQSVAETLARFSGKTTIVGHTDSRPYHDRSYTNWELSSDRANTTRRFLEQRVPELTIRSVVGKASQKMPDPDITKEEQRRISLLFYPDVPQHEHEKNKDTMGYVEKEDIEKQTSSLSSASQEDEQKTVSQDKKSGKKAIKYFI